MILSGSLQIIWLVFQVFELKSNAFDDQIANSDWHIFIKKILCAYFIITIISTAKSNSIAFLFGCVIPLSLCLCISSPIQSVSFIISLLFTLNRVNIEINLSERGNSYPRAMKISILNLQSLNLFAILSRCNSSISDFIFSNRLNNLN